MVDLKIARHDGAESVVKCHVGLASQRVRREKQEIAAVFA
jgi:hypothetical protein